MYIHSNFLEYTDYEMSLLNYFTKLITYVFALTKRRTYEKCIHKDLAA